MRKMFLAAAFAIAFAMQAAVGSSYTLTMQKVVAEVPDDIEESEYGHRSAPRPVECVIDATSGVEFVYGETPEFVSYEICDTEGATVASFGDETSFIEMFFTMTGEYQLRLVSADYEYVGWVML